MAKTTKSVQLFFQEQPSDKVYNAEIVEDGGQYTVKVEWGRRGAKLSTGTKAVKVTLAAAEKAFDKVVKQKTKKGYEVVTNEHQPAEVAPAAGEGSASKVAGEMRERFGSKAQLLNAVDDDRLEKLLSDEAFIAQQKLDGMRVLAHIQDDAIIATNRNSEISTFLDSATTISKALAKAPAGTIFDGELVHGKSPVYWIFDLLANGDTDLTTLSYSERYEQLTSDSFTATFKSKSVRLVPTATTEADKRKLLATLKKKSAEGIVLKESMAKYTSGRPASGGTALKYKFIKTADVVITENAGNAYRMAAHDGESLRLVGKVFAGTTNESRAELDRLLGDGVSPIAEVKYLYATDDLILFQPVFVRLRDDKDASECQINQLEQTDRSGLDEI